MRCVHLDFHTSPDIEGIGERFDKEQFAKTVKEANVDSITVFAKCHHGYTYYPSKVGTMHPHLKFNLLREQMEAARSVGVKTPIYIPIGWSKKDADDHPEWCQVDFYKNEILYYGSHPSPDDTPDTPIKSCTWTTLCPSNDGYLDYLEALTREVCENFDVSDGILFDICFMKETCICDSCVANMKKLGLDPKNADDVKKHYRLGHFKMMDRLSGVLHEYYKDADVFYNSGGADMNRPEYHPYQTYYSLEDLPTAWGGYDLMPIRAKSFEKYGKMYLGMTGKFHHAWGEFGGFKNKEALRYECADMLSVGASISIGDHLHPSGEIDKSTYAVISHCFDYVKKIEKYCENTRAYTDLALWLSHNSASDIGASKLLQIMHLEYDVIDSGEDISKYSCIVLPDKVTLTDDDKRTLCAFAERGGKIIASYASIFDELGIKKIAPSSADQDFIRYDVEDFTTPFLAYSSAYVTESDAEVLATVYEPYFNRTLAHFCGHKNTPYKLDAASYPALAKKGGVLYFAHPVFEAYNTSGNYVLERYVIDAIEKFYDKAIVTNELPSCARIRLRESKNEGFLALHVLYAPPVNRGNVCLLPDFPALHDVSVTLKVDRSISSVVSEPDGESIPFVQDGNKITLSLPPFKLHKLIVLK